MRSQDERAVTYLEEGLKNSLWPAGSRLPNIRALARSAGVASVAMQRAVRRLAGSKRITVQGRRGIYAGAHAPVVPAATCLKKTWEQVRLTLRQDILTGMFEDQVHLPGIRQLQKQYNVSPPTLRKALKRLVADNVLIIDKRKYRIVRARRPAHATILFICPGLSLATVKMYSGKFDEFYQALQSRCVRGNIRLAHCGVTDNNLDEVLAFLRREKHFFGYCIYATAIAPPAFSAIVRLLSLRGRPIALTVEGGQYPLPEIKCPHCLFADATVLAGRQVGNYLLELGHRSIAYLSFNHDTSWSQKRYQGLLQAYTEAGCGDTVKLVTVTQPKASPIHTPSQITAALDRLANVPKNFDWRETIPALEFYETASRMVRYLADTKDLRQAAQRSFTDLINDHSLTAVVISQDYLGVLFHAFLKRHGIAVPAKISLCGFDNAVMAMEDDLTTYNFLFGNIAADVIAYIINPAAFAGRQYIECSGTIMQRSTTGPAKRAALARIK